MSSSPRVIAAIRWPWVTAAVAVVVIMVPQVMADVDSPAFLRRYLVTEQGNAWCAVVRDPIDWPEAARAFVVDACWAVPCILAGWYSFVRRDVLG